MLEPSSTVIRADDLLTAALRDELVMMDVDSGKYYVLDDVASFIWSRVERPTEVAQLLRELQARYDVAAERCAADVLPFLRRLHDKGLLRLVT